MVLNIIADENLVWPYNLWFLLLSNESATLEGQLKVSQLKGQPADLPLQLWR